jgi:hypothetical protein
MFYAIFAEKDATITDVTVNGASRTGSNSGASEVSELYILTSSADSRGESRVIMQFGLTALSQSISEGLIPSGGVEYRLFLKNAQHGEELPYSFHLEVCPLSQTWAEGRGLSMYDEGLKDAGFANWRQATSLTNWTISGSSYLSSSNLTASQYFESGHEDLDVNISNIVNAWLTGGLTNNGLVIKYPAAYSALQSDFYVKKFFSRNSHATERVPKIAARWEKVIQDDRNNMFYGNSGTLYYYRFNNGVAQNVSGPLFVNIVNSSSVVTQTLTATLSSDGIYHASGVMVNYNSATQVYRDVWFSGTSQYFIGNFRANYATGSQFFDYDNCNLDIPNLKTFRQGEKVIVRVFIREKDYRPALASYASQTPTPLFMKDSYYQIQNAETEEVIVDFSTGSNKYSKLSYDENGNYFEMWTDSLKPEYIYKVRILVNHKKQTQVFDKEFTFKIDT